MKTSGLTRLAVIAAGTALVLPAVSTTGWAQPAPTQSFIVQLTAAPVASFTGDAGYSATKPGEGEKVDVHSPAARAYSAKLKQDHRDVLKRVSGSAATTQDYDVAFNGFAVDLTPDQAQRLSQQPEVANVWPDEIRETTTITTPSFLGLDGPNGVWAKLFGGTADAGKGIIIADIDSGIDPHNPSFAAMPGRSVPDSFKGVCDKGADPTFTCNNKLIGARYYGAPYNRLNATEIAAPTDRNSHGSHTASTAAGNARVPMNIQGIPLGDGSGMAPAAQISVYKALWNKADNSGASGSSSGLVAAINDAVADGADVINYSVSGSATSAVTPEEMAFFSAADAGVFVAAAAGNDGLVSSVNHNTPWDMTVAASTHDRAPYVRTVTLGNGATYEGAGLGADQGVGPASLVLSSDVALAGASADAGRLCFSSTWAGGPGLDPAKVAGKIVVCDRGVNDRVDKSLAVKQAGGIGMILANTAPQTTVADIHSVPTAHVDDVAGAAIKAYVAQAGAGATAQIGSMHLGAKPVAPEMADFSSYGPALAGKGNLLKPDIAAPGVNVLAAYKAAPDGSPQFGLMDGTSMATPHIAGLAALLMQRYPGWTPMMVKSAMMTTATTKDSAGRPIQRVGQPATPLNYGAGQVQAPAMFNPGLVYNSGAADWMRYLCAIGQGQSLKDNPCGSLPASDPSDLNYPTISVGALVGSKTVTRTVTNVEQKATQYQLSVQAPPGFTATVSPAKVTIPPRQSATYTVTFTRTTAPLGEYSFGSVTLSGNRGQVVTSQVALRPTA